MTTKYITTYSASGYVLSTSYAVVNIATAAGFGGGLFVNAYATVVNAGTVRSTSTSGSESGLLVSKYGGKVTNQAGGYIGSGHYGIASHGGLNLVNYGSIHGAEFAIVEFYGATIVNGGYGAPGASMTGTEIYLGASKVTNLFNNFGTVSSFILMRGGSLTNGALGDTTALITGDGGIYMPSAPGTVHNFATIQTHESDGSNGINIGDGGVVVNGAASDTVARIAGYTGVLISNLGTVTNFGLIDGAGTAKGAFGVDLAQGGALANGTGLDRGATIEGYTGVLINTVAGSITNFGTILGLAAATTHYGVGLADGGVLTNGGGVDRTALVAGAMGIVAGGAATISNFATVIAYAPTGVGVEMAAGSLANGSANNAVALIEGYTGASVSGAASLHNFGSILGMGDAGGAGVVLAGADSLINGGAGHAKSLISGFEGVDVTAASATVTNFATIAGAYTAVSLAGASDRLIVEAGATFVGSILGGGGTLELAGGSGTLSGLLSSGALTLTGATTTATTAVNFGAVTIDSAASFVLATGTVAAGRTLTIAGSASTSGTLAIAGALALTGALGGTGTLSLIAGNTSLLPGAALTIAQVKQSGAAVASFTTPSLTYGGTWTQSAGTVTVGATDGVTFTGTGDSFAGTLTGAGAIAFVGGSDTFDHATLSAAAMSVSGASVTVSGLINLVGVLTVATSALTVATIGATLSGGTVQLSDSSANLIVGASSAAKLTNKNDTIAGAGQLGDGALALVNDAGAVIDGTGAANALIINTGAGTFQNLGLVESTAAGGLSIVGGLTNYGTLAVSAGTLSIGGTVSGTGSVTIAGGTADFASTFNQNVAFTATTGVLELAHSQTYKGKVTGLSTAGTSSLDLLDIAFGGSTTATFSGTASSGTLTVTDGSHTARISLLGNYVGHTFNVSSDGHGGTVVKDPDRTAGGGGGHLAPLVEAIAAFAPTQASAAGVRGDAWWAAAPPLVYRP